MYKAFYGLTSSPFQISTDPTFLWLGEKHREAISMLRYGIQGEGHPGLVLLTGNAGTGKTTLINALFKSLDQTVIRVSIINPHLDGLDFLNYIAAAFGSRKSFSTKGRFLIAFERFLKNAGIKKKKVLLVIDEAQLLTDELLEEIRLLANFEKNGQSLIHIFLVGQQKLRVTLSRSKNTALKQRITLNYHIHALVPEETAEYIKYRLQVAGTSRQIFNPEAVSLVHRFSSGLPRQINIICDHALLTGYVRNLAQIPGAMIKECLRELSISRIPDPHRDTHPPRNPKSVKQKMRAADAGSGQARATSAHPPGQSRLPSQQGSGQSRQTSAQAPEQPRQRSAQAPEQSRQRSAQAPEQPRQRSQQAPRPSRQHDTRTDLAADPPPVIKKGNRLYLAIIVLAVLLGVAAAGFLFL